MIFMNKVLVIIAVLFMLYLNAAAQDDVMAAANKLAPGVELMRADFGLNEDNIAEVQETLGNTLPVSRTYVLYVSKTDVVIIEEITGKAEAISLAVLIDPLEKKVKKTGNVLTASVVPADAVLTASKRALAVYEIFTRGGSPKPGVTAVTDAVGKPAKTDGPVYSSPETIDLIKAAEVGDAKGVVKQLGAGADINGKTMDSLQVTALMKASEKGRQEIVKLLIEKGAIVNIISRFGFTALMFAADSGKKESVKALLDAGADVNKVGHMFATALNWAKNDKIRGMLKKAGAK
jgi:hypothetical protein